MNAMISEVRIEGYKCLREVTAKCGPFNVLIGANDTGKTSFLEAVREYHFWALGDQPGPVATHFEARRKPGALLIEVKHARPNVRYDGDAWRASADLVVEIGAYRSPLHLKGVRPIEPLRITEPFCLDAQAVASVASQGEGTLDALVRSRGRGTAAHLASLRLNDQDRFKEIQAALQDATQGRVREIKVVEAEPPPGFTLSYVLHDDTKIAAQDASQGILVYTCFLALVHRADRPNVLLIEEPENGVHPLRLKSIVDLLRSLTLGPKPVQVFLTTHSPDLLSFCRPEEVLVFWRPDPDSASEIHTLPPDFETRIAMGDPLGQVWASRGEEGLLDMLPAPRPFHREPRS